MGWLKDFATPIVIALVGVGSTYFISKAQTQSAEKIAQSNLDVEKSKAKSDEQVKILEIFSDLIKSPDVIKRLLALRYLNALEPDLAGKLALAVQYSDSSVTVRSAASAIASRTNKGIVSDPAARPLTPSQPNASGQTSSAIEQIDPQCPKPSFPPEQMPPYKPYRSMTLAELKIELSRCAADIVDIRQGTYDVRSSLVHALMTTSGMNPPKEEIDRNAFLIDQYNRQDRDAYWGLRKPILALRQEILSRLKLTPKELSEDKFTAADKAASTLPAAPTNLSDFNTSNTFDEVSAYLSELDEKLSKFAHH